MTRLALAAVLLAAAPAHAATRDFDLQRFDRVSSGGSFDVVITTGRGFSVRAEGPASAIERIEAEVDGGELKLWHRRGVRIWDRAERVVVRVTAPEIRAVSSSGSGDMTLDRGEGPRFAAAVSGSGDVAVGRVRAEAVAASVSGSGNLDLGEVAAESAQAAVAGSGNLTARGGVRQLAVKVAGSGDADLSRVSAAVVSAAVTGSGDIRANARETASVAASGSGDVDIGGAARCAVRKSGSSSVRCGV